MNRGTTNGVAQRASIEPLTLRFNQYANFPEMIDNGTIASIVQLAGGGQSPSVLAASRFRYDPCYACSSIGRHSPFHDDNDRAVRFALQVV